MLEQFLKKKKLRIGVAPVRREAWSHKPFNLDEAVAYKERILQYIQKYDAEDVEFLTLDHLTEDGLLYRQKDVEMTEKYFRDQEVDGLFIPHCNFGCEEVEAVLAKKLGKPILLWGPKDDIHPDDLYRYRDSQCGLFAASKVLQMYGVPFTYIENCDVEDAVFDEGIRKFFGVVSVVKAFRGMKIGQIGTRPAPFASVKCNEMELLEQFGIQVVPMTLTELQKRFEKCRAENRGELEDEAEKMEEEFQVLDGSRDQLNRIAALKRTVEDWALEEGLSAAVAMCWGPMIDTVGIAPCFVLGAVCEDGFPFICETDIHGAVSAVLALAAARYTTPIFLADITIRHPDNPQGELLWHCGVFPKSLAKKGEALVINHHYNRLCPAVGEWELKGGPLTVVRFDGIGGQYSLFLGKAKGTEGPKTVGAYLWIEVEDWKKWEEKLIYGPYIHHCVGIHAQVTEILEESCRYLPGLQADLV